MELTKRQEQEPTKWEHMKDTVRQGFRNFGKAAFAVGFSLALPLVAAHMTGCGGLASRPMDDAGPDARITDASPDVDLEEDVDSDADGELDSALDSEADGESDIEDESDADAPHCRVVEMPGVVVETEQELAPSRVFDGYDCDDDDGLALEYDGHSFDVLEVDTSTSTLGWNFNTIEVEVAYPDGSTAVVELSCNAVGPVDIGDGLSIWSTWSMSEGGLSCAQLTIYDSAPFTASLMATVDRVIYEGDPSCEAIISETLVSLEVELPSEPWFVQEDDTYTLHSLLDSTRYNPLNLGIFGLGRVVSSGEGDGFHIADGEGIEILEEGGSVRPVGGVGGIDSVTLDEVLVSAPPYFHVTFYDGLGETVYASNIGSYFSYVPPDGYIRLNGTSNGPLEMVLIAYSMNYGRSFVDGATIEAGGAEWAVSVGPNEEGVPRSALSFTRVE